MAASRSTIVIGHRNPDNDSICAAVGYAYLKNQLDPDGNYVACRQGPLPDETAWILERMGVPVPQYVTHIHSRAMDAMTPDVISVRSDDILLNAGRKMREHGIRALVVVDPDGKYAGIVTMRSLSEIYIDEVDMVDTYKSRLKLGNIAKACGGRIVLGDPEKVLDGHLRVAASEPETFRALISEGDTVVMGDRKRSQLIACEEKVACLVLAVGAQPSKEIVDLARQNGTAIICADQDTYTVTRLTTLSRVIGDCIETDALVFDPETLLADVVPELLHSHQREGVVVDEDGYCLGIITRSDIASIPRRRVALVDHNERAQSLPGIEEADVVDIVDHHRVGDIQTSGPIQFLLLPWGSSATIVADQYRVHRVQMPRAIAGVLLSAVLTDTVLMKSPTTTDMDRDVASWLGKILDVDPIEFGIELFHRKGDDAKLDIETFVGGDAKEYEIADKKVLVAQHETANMEVAMSRTDEIQAHIEELGRKLGYDTVLFLLTDIVNVGSRFFVAGDARMVERAFGIDLSEGPVWVGNILSRKKQVITRLMGREG